MTEQELIELAKKCYVYLNDVPRELITKNVIDNMEVERSKYYHLTLEGINPECISKEKALQLLLYDKEVYGLLTRELQKDEDVLKIVTENLEKLPKSLFYNKDGLNYILDKWNVDGKSWAVCDWRKKSLIIKRDVNVRKYIFYIYGLIEKTESDMLSEKFLEMTFLSDEHEACVLSCEPSRFNTVVTYPVKHLD